MKEILHDSLPYDLSRKRPLPAVAPLEPEKLLIKDSAYAAQMAERERLIKDYKKDVIQLDPSAFEAAQELLDYILNLLPVLDGFTRDNHCVSCPDGRSVFLNYSDP